MEGDEAVIARASWVSYALLWLIVAGIAALQGVLAVKEVDGALVVVMALLFAALTGTVALSRLRLGISRSEISYRGVFRKVNIPLSALESVQGSLIGREFTKYGLVRGPGFYLILNMLSAGERREILVNLKPFDRRDLCRFLSRAKADNVPLYVDQAIASALRWQG